MTMNFTTATSFITATKSLIGKTAIMTTVKIRMTTAVSGIAGHTCFPKIGLSTSRSSQKSYRLVHLFEDLYQVKILDLRQERTFWQTPGSRESAGPPCLTKSHSRPSICFLGSRNNAHQMIEYPRLDGQPRLKSILLAHLYTTFGRSIWMTRCKSIEVSGR